MNPAPIDRSSPWILAVCALSAFAFVGRVGAEDMKQDPAAPSAEKAPAFPEGKEAFLVPTTAGDLRQFVTTLRTQLERLQTPPPSTPEWTDLRDAWRSILKPRIGMMIVRVKTWEDDARWETVEGNGTGQILKPDQWDGFVRDMSQLAAELHGAWTQYQRVEIERKVDQRDSPQLVPDDPSVTMTIPTVSIARGIRDRQVAALGLSRPHLGTYWHLLNGFQSAWEWGWLQRTKWYKYWERRTSLDRLMLELRAELAATQATLAQLLLGLQVYVGALQRAEEERLLGICAACKTDDATLREMAETALRDMATARLEAESIQIESPSKYGSLLRAWLRRLHAASAVLDMTGDRLEKEATPAPAPASEEDGAVK